MTLYPDARRIVVFARTPELGCVKTRLAAELGAAAALAAYREMGARAVAAARGVPGAEVVIAYAATTSPASRAQAGAARDEATIVAWLGAGSVLRPQVAGDLGARMAAAFEEAFAEGAARVAVVGTDCPALSPRHLAAALDRLDDADVVLGPAADGGYYLIALARPIPDLFRDIPWSASDTRAATLAAAGHLGLRVALLEELTDVDTADDWRAWRAADGASSR